MTESALTWEAPGPGTWTLDLAHVPRPLTPFWAELYTEPSGRGFTDTTPRYGALLDKVDIRFANGLMYSQPVPVGGGGSGKLPPKWLFSLLLKVHPELRRRIKSARTVYDRKPWRDDLRYWEDEIKPAVIARNKELQAVDVQALSSEDLLAHLDACREHLVEMVYYHHYFDLAALAPLADFLAHAVEWTNLGLAELFPLMKGATEESTGTCPELKRLLAALATQPDVVARLASANLAPAEKVDALLTAEGEVGQAARDYYELVGHRVADGYDIDSATVGELPEVFVRCVLSRLDSAGPEAPALEAIAASVRDRVPEEHRQEFDELLEEARDTYGLRDQRGLYTDIWASGITRKAVLELGRRLAAEGRLEAPEHLMEAKYEEMVALGKGQTGPTAAELAGRADERASLDISQAPQRLGPEMGPPPPVDWFPPGLQRMLKAQNVAIETMFGEPESSREGKTISGLSVQRGVYEGTARIIGGPQEFGRLQQGDVLVTRSTSPAFNIVLPLLGGLVTERGGLLSHAAIVAREYGIPAVVSCHEAMTAIADGARVRVDGDNGAVTVL
ncbi:MAG TPA: PEP-utilizing enzyme [Dehalococcoidia bacterium]|nr:PEP-utilizing enzyme [Dehalococcoidia bacterium]